MLAVRGAVASETMTAAGYWQDRAACAAPGAPDMFATAAAAREYRRALALCRECPVRMPCYRDAVEMGATFGIWGAHDFGRATRRDRRMMAAALTAAGMPTVADSRSMRRDDC